MATPWSDLEAQLWAWLETSEHYKHLRLRAYRGHRGEFMPYDAAREVPVMDVLPAIEIRAKDMGVRGPEPTRQREPIEGQVVDFVEVTLTLIYASREAGYPRALTIEPAMAAILDRLNERDARAYGMTPIGEQGVMSGYAVTNSAFRELNGGEDDNFTWLWAWELTLELYGKCRQVN